MFHLPKHLKLSLTSRWRATLLGFCAMLLLATLPARAAINSSSFAPKVDFTTGSGPQGVAVGDLDGDGKLDLIVANQSSNSVSVLRNTSTSGSASFASKVDFTTGSVPISVVIGDLDGDGKLDLAVANGGSNSVSVLRNTSTSGSASFAPKVDFATGSSPSSVAVGDLDGDGKLDLALANGGTILGSGSVSVLRNTSTSGNLSSASFAAKVDFATGSNPQSVAVGDLDGDGKLDLVAGSGARVSVLRNTSTSGSASFDAKVDFATGSSSYSMAVGDLDGDGKLDLALASSSSSVSVLRNTSTSGSISFASQSFLYGAGLKSVAVGDLDGDGKLDLALANSGITAVSVWQNTSTSGSVSFGFGASFATGSGPQGVAVGDLDGDGKLDLAVSNSSSNSVSVLRNTPPTPEIDVKGNSVSIASGDSIPSAADHSDFGSVNVSSGTVVRTFTIQNTGTAALSVSAPTLSGANATDFSVTSAPASSVAANGSTTFQITFDPAATGTRTAMVTITNNDSDEGTYTFVIQGTGTQPSVPEIDVLGNSVSIISGDSTPSSSDHTDFGSANINSSTVVRTFTVQNTGTGALTLSGSPLVVVGGANASDFTVTQPTVSSVAANSSTTFQITFDPSAAGVRTAIVSIANNDSNENPYTFTIQGTGTLPAPNLSIPSTARDASNGSFSVPVNFTGDGASIASVGFALDLDACLTIDNTDADSNGIPDAISGLPAGFQATISYNGNDTTGELDLFIFDNAPPIAALNDGTLLTVNLTVVNSCVTTNGSTHAVTVGFASTPAISFSDIAANDVAGTATGGTLTLSFNATPTAINLSANTVDENAAAGTTIGTLSTIDPDAGDSHTYALVAGAADNASFTIVGNTLKSAASFDYETKASYTVRVRTTDNGGLNGSFEQDLTVTVVDVYEAPTGIDFGGGDDGNGGDSGGDDGNPATLDVNENTGSGGAIATFGPANPDTTNSYTFALVDGEGSADNGSFTFVGNELRVNAPLNAEGQSSYTIRVRITDEQGNTVEQIFTVTVNDINDAPVAVNDPGDLYAAIYVGGQATAIQVLANDTDDDGDTLSVASIATAGTQGSVTNNNTNVSYTAPNANGSSSFTYQAGDGQANSNSATVTVTYVKNDQRGDCNANGAVTAADAIATVLEIFDDGDGQVNSNPAWWLVYLGDYAGSPRGCDANGGENGDAHTSESVTVADITCTILIFFGNSCGTVTAQSNDGMTPATISAPQQVAAAAGESIGIDITLNTAGNPVASAGFALVLDGSQVRFDPTDSDGDGVPDAIAIHAPASMTKSVRWNADRSRLEVAIFGASLPLPTLGDGPLATVTLTVADNASGDSPLALQLVSLGNTSGDDVAVNGQDGSLRIGGAAGQIFLPFVQR